VEADQPRDEDGEVELARDRLERRHAARDLRARHDVAVADGRERREAEVGA
jgi:hypothetical protein